MKIVRNQFLPAILLFTIVFGLALFKLNEGDILFHIKQGGIIWETGEIPGEDIFTFTMEGARWTNHEWGSAVIFYLIRQLTGFDGIVIFKAVLTAVAFLILYRCSLFAGAGPWISLPLFSLGAATARFHMYARPQIFTYLFLSLIFSILLKNRGNHDRRLWALPVIMIVWGNLHAACILGIIFYGAFILLELIRPVFPFRGAAGRYKKRASDLKFKALIGALMIGGLFANPSTYRLPLYLFEIPVGDSSVVISEWLPAYSQDSFPLFWGMAIMFVLSFIFSIKRTNSFITVIGTITLISAVLHVRNIELFSMFGGVAIALQGTICLYKVREIIRKRQKGELPVKALKQFTPLFSLTAVFIPVFIIFFTRFGDHPVLFEPGVGLNRKAFPIEACDFLQEYDLNGRIYNDSSFAGYLVWRWGPERKVFWDVRTEYTLPIMEEVMRTSFSDYLDKMNVQIALNDLIITPGGFLHYFLNDGSRWALVYVDDLTALFLRRSPQNASIIARFEYKHYRPDLDPILVPDPIISHILEEMNDPKRPEGASYRNLVFEGFLHTRQKEFSRAEEHLKKAFFMNSCSGIADIALAFLFLEKNDLDRAYLWAKRSVKSYTAFPFAYRLAAHIDNLRGQPGKAIRYLETYLETAPDDLASHKYLAQLYEDTGETMKQAELSRKIEVLENRVFSDKIREGLLHQTMFNYAEAEKAYQEAQTLKPRMIESLLYLGKLYEEIGRFDWAEKAYKDAIDNDPGTAISYLYLSRLYVTELNESVKALPYLKKYIEFAENQPSLPFIEESRKWLNEITAQDSYGQYKAK